MARSTVQTLFLCGLFLLLTACAPRRAPKPTPPLPPKIPAAQQTSLQEAYQKALPFLRASPKVDPNLNFDQLRRQLRQAAKGLSKAQIEDGLYWIKLVETQPAPLAALAGLSLKASEPVEKAHWTQSASGAILPPDSASLWRHCRLAFTMQKGGQVHLAAGWQSPAALTWQMAQGPGSLRASLQRWGLPGYSPFHSAQPPLAYKIDSGNANDLIQLCRPLGLEAQGPFLRFIGLEALYQPILTKLPPELAEPLRTGLERASFYPSPEGLRVILSMGFKESSLQWDPALTLPKKQEMRDQFLAVLSTTESSWGAALTQMVLSKRLLNQKEQLATELRQILEPKKRSTEYDFYRWTRKANRFLKELLKEHGQLAKLGSKFLDIEKKLGRLEKEPQTFGLFQLNVNHLAEKLARQPRLARRFVPVMPRGQPDRDALVRSLSGLPHAPLNLAQTFELIFRAELAPRYRDHLRGEPGDLYYFAAENLTGPLSTYRTAIQARLSETLRRPLTLDGDLAFSLPYSRRLDPKRRSNSQKALLAFAKSRAKELKNPDKEVLKLLKTTRYDQLAQTPLYQLLMKDHLGERQYPQISSELYHQTPRSYASRVLKEARQF
ncbi:MAG: hypothetical protein RRB13_09230 [bacterium]|nr:hypothetical protein [bacterium]